MDNACGGTEQRPLVDEVAAGPPPYAATLDGEPPSTAMTMETSTSQESLGAAADRRHSGLDDRQRFQSSRHGEVQSAVFRREFWRSPLAVLLGFFCFILLATPPAIILYIECRSWYVLFKYGQKPCDQDLVFWLAIRNVMTITAPRMPAPGSEDLERAERQERAARCAATLWVSWLIVGFLWVHECVKCQTTNPELYNWVKFLTLFSLIVHILNIFFPLLFQLCVIIYHSMIARGWLKSPNAARDDAIERMEVLEFNPQLFGSLGVSRECCCCMEEFGVGREIVRTPCSHYYHRDCLKEWLRLAKTCPLCRNDIDAPAQPETVV